MPAALKPTPTKSRRFHARGKRLALEGRTAIMGVVNVTPDSFYRESRRPDPLAARDEALAMLRSGADILDIGGESSRPGARPVSAEQECDRIAPVIAGIRNETDALISIDTRKAAVAREALALGADIVNDISALRDEGEMASLVASSDAGLVLMHMQGEPETMQRAPHYQDVVLEVRAFLARAIETAVAAGVSREAILIDPGIGFGKKVEHNLALLNRLSELSDLERPILVGTSRKGFLGKLVGAPAESRLMGTAASVAAAILRGAQVIRVHDVAEMRHVATVVDAITRQVPRKKGLVQ